MLCNPSLWFVSPQGKGGGRAAPAGGVGASPQQERAASEEPARAGDASRGGLLQPPGLQPEEEHGVRQEAPHAHGAAARLAVAGLRLAQPQQVHRRGRELHGGGQAEDLRRGLRCASLLPVPPALRRLRTASPRRLEEALRGQEGGEVTQREQTADRPALHRRAHHRGSVHG